MQAFDLNLKPDGKAVMTGVDGSFTLEHLSCVAGAKTASQRGCLVEVVDGAGKLQDLARVTPRGDPSVTPVDLLYGRRTNQLLVSGTVLAPGQSAPASAGTAAASSERELQTDIQITDLSGGRGQTYDASSTCRAQSASGMPFPWAGGRACASGAGSYLLDLVPRPSSGKTGKTFTGGRFLITLLERHGIHDSFTAVDSTTVTLTDNLQQILTAPPLHELP